jgi:hypothetical protein
LTLRLSASLDLAKRLPTGSPRVEHLPEKTQESARKGKGALPTVGAIIRRAEQMSWQQRLQQDLELGQRQLPERGLAGPGPAEFLEESGEMMCEVVHMPYIYGIRS